MAPAPVWKTNPSVKRLDAAITSTARLAISEIPGIFCNPGRSAPILPYRRWNPQPPRSPHTLGNTDRNTGVFHQMIGNDDHLSRRHRIDKGNPARRRHLPHKARRIAVIIGRRRADKCHVDGRIPLPLWLLAWLRGGRRITGSSITPPNTASPSSPLIPLASILAIVPSFT